MHIDFNIFAKDSYYNKNHPLHHLCCIDLEECFEIAETVMRISNEDVETEIKRLYPNQDISIRFREALKRAKDTVAEHRGDLDGS